LNVLSAFMLSSIICATKSGGLALLEAMGVDVVRCKPRPE
jgi:hypothetical protein